MASFHPKVQISDVPDFTFINKIDLPNFRVRSWVAFIHRYVASFHTKVQISDVPDFTFINKIDLPNFRGCLNNWRYHSGGSFAIFEHAPLLLPTANCSPPTFCEFP